jgi:hypothetical protein
MDALSGGPTASPGRSTPCCGETTRAARRWMSGCLAGDLRSEAYGVNIGGQVVGASFGSAAGRGFIYQNAALAELTPLLDTPFAA